MHYKILEAKIEFRGSEIRKITVLVDCTSSSSNPLSDVRAIYSVNRPTNGYFWILPSTTISPDLFQKVAGFGMQTKDGDKIFPKWKTNLKS